MTVNRTPLAAYRAARTPSRDSRAALAIVAGLIGSAVSIWAMCAMAESHAARPHMQGYGVLPTLADVQERPNLFVADTREAHCYC